ncbi:CgeB family protein [Listeria grandensis]|uniref:CgeB family protein n=1 Tax=Listeria grandensis TaxID=1494963 RepID=UPI00068B9F46|nr:glycosyltransferase [Listeria grandensis]
MPFAAQPLLHNPIKLLPERRNKICFAGSYYANRHPARRQDMDQILDISAAYGLDIFDRNFERQDVEFQFPERFRDFVVGSLPYHRIEEAYKGYKYTLNVNSVKESPTMFSRRVFESLACGTPVVSSYSRGISEMFGELVMMPNVGVEITKKFEMIHTDLHKYRQKAMMGIRVIYGQHTYAHRIQMILENAGIAFCPKEATVTLLARVSSPESFYKVRAIFENQAYPHKKLAIFMPYSEDMVRLMESENDEQVSIYIQEYADQYKTIQALIDTNYYGYISQIIIMGNIM